MTDEPDLPTPEDHSRAAASPQAGTPSSFDFTRLRRGDLVAGIASFVVFISLFLPWYGFAATAATQTDTSNATLAQQQLVLTLCSGQPALCSSDAPPQVSIGALDAGAGGWRFLILVVAIISVLYVVGQAVPAVARAVPFHWQLLAGLAALQAILVLIAFAANPLDLLDPYGSSSWAAGAVIALIAAIAAGIGAFLVMQDSRSPLSVTSAPPGASIP